MTESSPDICAVIVSYRPDLHALARLIGSMASQVNAMVLVDNGSGEDCQKALAGMLAAHGGHLLAQRGNLGLAAAQNLGIAWARARGARHVLLLDQDSEPEAGMTATLLDALQRLSARTRVAAVGPRFHDRREHRSAPFVRIGFPFNRKIRSGADGGDIASDFLISSGTLVPIAVFDAVGVMDKGLFIDNVDLEWSFRARAAGYALFGVCAATMHHRLGDARRELPFGLGRIVVHGPRRLYFMMRNRLLLYRMPHTPRLWIAQDLPRLTAKLLLFGLLVAPRREHLRFMARGLRDGLRGRRGDCPIDAAPR